MASRFETFSEGEVCAINEEVVHSNTKIPRIVNKVPTK